MITYLKRYTIIPREEFQTIDPESNAVLLDLCGFRVEAVESVEGWMFPVLPKESRFSFELELNQGVEKYILFDTFQLGVLWYLTVYDLWIRA